jgi:hypothetical protein
MGTNLASAVEVTKRETKGAQRTLQRPPETLGFLTKL